MQSPYSRMRVADDDTRRSWRERLVEAGLYVSPIIARFYFHAICFRCC